MATEAPNFYIVEEEHHEPGGSTMLGFWMYLMSDALIFATLFALYGVLGTSFAGGPTPSEIFALPLVAVNTALLLTSSITYGFAMIAMQEGKLNSVRLWLVLTGLLGIGFVGIELYEFSELIHLGATPQTSAFLSAFFLLVATHGLHVTFGIIWLVVMLFQLKQRGLHPENQRRLMCLSMFWHFLDIVWIGVFTFVYLLGVIG
ncbi:MAG: cytochrome o ubiquinol oxidase subunit III [Sphingomonadales bacterium]|nr:MAG: cytochrome o ubiquinol oxidase subunit III [Sphingomonadales bacterium]